MLLGCVFPDGSVGKEAACNAGDTGDGVSIPGSGISPGEGNGGPLQYSCLEKSHGQRSLVGCSPWGCKEPDVTERLTHTHTAHECNTLLVAGSWEGSALFGSPVL